MKAGTGSPGQQEKGAGRIRESSKTLYRGKVFSVRRHRVREPGGFPEVRDIVHHNGVAVILPCFEDDRVALVRQFRLAAGSYLWELPAGTMDPGETPLQTARRELEEETGYRAGSWRKLVEFFASPGFLDEKLTIFLARNILPGQPHPESDERIRVRRFRPAQWQSLIRSGRIRDGKTIVGLLYYQCFTRGMFR